MDEKTSKHVHAKIKEATTKQSQKEKHSPLERRVGYLFSIAITGIVLYYANQIPNWHISWLADNYSPALWLLKISLVVTIIINFIYIIIDPKWLRAFGQLAQNIISFVVMETIYQTFPFNINYDTEKIVRLILIIILICLAISIIVEALKFLVYSIKALAFCKD